MAVESTSRTFSVSFPPDLAEKAEAIAERQSRSVSEVLGDALRNYYSSEVSRFFAEIGEYATSRPVSYTEEDIPRLIKEVRAEMREEELLKGQAKAR